MATRTCASAVDAPRCGVRTVLGASRSGESRGGSEANTSTPAPPSPPSRSASARAASSTTPPPATLKTIAPPPPPPGPRPAPPRAGPPRGAPPAAGHVEDDRARPHRGDGGGVEQVARRARERDVQGEHVAAGDHLRTLEERHAVVRRGLRGHERVVA